MHHDNGHHDNGHHDSTHIHVLETMTMRPAVFDHMTVLADSTRGRILLALERRELAVSELCAVLQMPQSTVSRHLKVLADDSWLRSRRDGTSRHYTFEPEHLGETAQRLWQLAREEIRASAAAAQDRLRLRAVLAERRARSREFFTTSAGQWDHVRRELFGQSSEISALLGLIDPAWVVGDLGCGTGRTSAALAPFVQQVIAVDHSEAMLEEAQRRLAGSGVELRQGELEELPISDGELDAALLLLVLHHVADPASALAEVRRALRPGGRLLIVDMEPHDRHEYHSEMGHLWLGFEEGQLDGWLEGAGFSAAHRVTLPPDPQARGPMLFAASAVTAPRTARNVDTTKHYDLEPVPDGST